MNNIQGIDQLLGELRSAAAMASGKPAAAPAALDGAGKGVDFSDILKQSIDKVAETQGTSVDMQKRYELGDESVNLHDVMLSPQKASLSFQTMVQVRNKLVTAYQEVMNTQI